MNFRIKYIAFALLAFAISANPSILFAEEPGVPTVAELLRKAQTAENAVEAIDLASQALE